ncbi:GH25 family lysozyme [Niallia alba]|uniref:DUF7359 domain-containing protein n=1 Tax=Niallia alba TaxID=2729105 RepID=UPI0039A11A9F
MGKIADISKWQGTVDWAKASTDLDLVIIRVQYGSNLIDSKYKEYVTGAKQYNIPFGHYAYAQYVSVNDAIQEAKDFWSRADKSAHFYVIDVEEITTYNASDLVPATQAFIDYLHNQGAEKVGLYSGDSFYKTNNLSQVKADFLWIARYGVNNGQPSTKPSVACDLWQYTSVGSVSGISGNVDLNALNGSKPLTYFTTTEVTTPTPEPVPTEPEIPVVPVEEEEIELEEPIQEPVVINYDKVLVNPNNRISSYIVRKGDKVAKPQLFLATPNGQTIADLSLALNKKLTLNFTDPNELSFSLPYEIEVQNKLITNKTINLIRERYLVKLLFAGVESWYIITSKQPSSSDVDLLNINCFSLEYELKYKKVIGYQATSLNCIQVLDDTLKNTNWSIGYINDEFNLKYHQFDVSSSSKLDFINEICKIFNAYVIYDTVNKKVNICKEEEVSIHKGFWIEYGKYLQNIEQSVEIEDVITRLHVSGSDKVAINSVNPTGQSYIDDFSYFLYPFEMDERGNVTNHSYYMSDELCIALINYNKLVESNEDSFSSLLKEKSTLQVELSDLQAELRNLENQLTIILDNIQIAKNGGNSTSELIAQRNSKETEITNKKNEISAKETSISNNDKSITQLNTLLKIENNITGNLFIELNDYIFEDEFSDNNVINDADLYDVGIAELKKLSSPPINISMGIVNFFAVLEEKHNWNRLSIGDIIRVRHKKLGIDVRVTVSSLSFDFENYSINIAVTNAKRPKSIEDRIINALYTIDKVNTDYSKRKRNWNTMLTNFNTRNDRIGVKPNNPTDLAITHKTNDNGSVDLTINWNYKEFEKTKNDSDNIDGFLVYMYSDVTNERYVFGSTISDETTVSVNSTIKTYTFPNVPPNRFYTIGIQAYRDVDDDINVEGYVLSDLITPTTIRQNPYQPSEVTVVNGFLNGKVNGAIYVTSDVEPDSPEINKTVWTNPASKQQMVYTENGFEPMSAGDASSVSGYPTEVNDIPNSIPIRSSDGYINASITGDAYSVGNQRPGIINGLATLDSTGNVPTVQLGNASKYEFGTYIGDGTSDRLIPTSFSPTLIKVYTTDSTDSSLFIPSIEGGFLFGQNNTLTLPLTSENGKLNSLGFYTGNSSEYKGNKLGITYYWEAYRSSET